MSCPPRDFMCVVNNCSGAIGSGTELFNYWQTNNCPAAYSEAINTGTGGTLVYNPVQQQFIQGKVVDLFNTYFITNSLTDDVTSTSFDPFQFTLLDLCTDPTLPGICGEFLNNYCDDFSRSQAINSPTLTNFCGCYVPPDPKYLEFTLGSPECLIGATGCTAGCTGGTGCTGQPACDPLCHRALTSQKAFQPTGNFITCPETICAIDNVVINATSSRVPGGVNFNTVCAGCGGPSGGDGCLCIVSGVNISATAGQIGLGTNFNEFCGPSSVCIVEDSAGNIISEGGCTGINPINIGVSGGFFRPTIGIIFIMALIVLIFLFIAIAARSSSQKIYTDTLSAERELQRRNPQYLYTIQ